MERPVKLRHFEKGITLPGILVVVIIIAVIAFLIIPSTVSYFHRRRLMRAAEVLYHDLHDARSEAIHQQRNITIVFQQDKHWCYGVTTASNCNCMHAASCNLGQVDSSEYPGVEMVVAATKKSAALSIVYHSDKSITSEVGAMQFVAGGKTIRVSVNALGFPSICSVGDVAEYTPCQGYQHGYH